MSLLAVEGLGVHRGSRALLADLTFSVAAGEIVGLLGASGAGKSLTALALAGLLPPGLRPSGRVAFAGQQLLTLGEREFCGIRGRGIGLIFQEPATALNPLMTIAAQVAETVRVHEPHADADAAAARALARVGLGAESVPPDRYPHQLSGGQRQRVALAMATALTPRLLIADEPTTALDVMTQARMLALLGQLVREDGMGLLLISHDLAVLADLADRLLVLADGTLVEQGPTAAVLGAPSDRRTRAWLSDWRSPSVAAPAAAADGAPLLEASGVSREYPLDGNHPRGVRRRVVDSVSLRIAGGERVALIGESGSGKSTLLRTLLALERPDAGRVCYAGIDLAAARPAVRRALRRLVQPVFQDPYASLDPRQRIGRIIAEPLALLAPAPPRAERARRIEAALAAVGLPATAAVRWPHEFSGGERQRIAIARALIIEPRLLLLDEAVSALDVSLRTQILRLLAELASARGLGYLIVAHDLRVVRAITTRTLVMRAGRIIEDGPTTQVLEAPRQPYTAELIAAMPDLSRSLAARSA